jgi:hypothetical protein
MIKRKAKLMHRIEGFGMITAKHPHLAFKSLSEPGLCLFIPFLVIK